MKQIVDTQANCTQNGCIRECSAVPLPKDQSCNANGTEKSKKPKSQKITIEIATPPRPKRSKSVQTTSPKRVRFSVIEDNFS